jgi:hypothetical protein
MISARIGPVEESIGRVDAVKSILVTSYSIVSAATAERTSTAVKRTTRRPKTTRREWERIASTSPIGLQLLAEFVTLTASFGAVDAPFHRLWQDECHMLDARQWLKVKARREGRFLVLASPTGPTIGAAAG